MRARLPQFSVSDPRGVPPPPGSTTIRVASGCPGDGGWCPARGPGGVAAAILPAGPFSRPGANRRLRAFSLLQIIGVLAVMAILAGALAPALMRDLGERARRQEAETLSVITVGLREHILNHRRIPGPATVFTDVATQIGWPAVSVATNVRGQARVFLVDPAFRAGTNTATTLPYVQGVYGATNLAGTRFMLVSSLGGPLPAVIANPGTNAATVFEMLWNAPEATEPAGWTWGGDWRDILVQRLSLLPYFSQVILNNASTYTGRFSVDNTNHHVPLPSNPFSSFYFVRTVIGLHGDTNTLGGALQARQILQDVTTVTNASPYYLCPSFVYENGVWRGRLFSGTQAQKHNGEDLQAAMDIFMSGPANVYQVGSVTQASLRQRMWEFMSNYVRWTELGFSSTFKQQVLQPSQSAMASELGTYCNKKASVN